MNKKKFDQDITSIQPHDNLEDLIENIDSDELEKQKELLELQRYKEDTKDRKDLAIWTKWIVMAWLCLVMIILFSAGFCKAFHLSDNVLIALLGTTTFNVLGLSYIVLKGYFENR